MVSAQSLEQKLMARLDAPHQDEEAVALAQTLAAAVHAELAALEFPVTFDEWMQARRGRRWLP